MATKPLHPEVLYAERSSATEPEKNIIFLTFNTPNIQGDPTLDIESQSISFAANTGDPSKGIPVKEWACDIELWGEVIPAETKKVVTSRAVVLVLRKKEPRAEYWPRLTKEKPNRNWIKTDFSKWVDEDEQDGEVPEVEGMGGMPGMGGGMGGMGGMEEMLAGMGGGGMGGMPGMGGMGGMPGMGGMGGMPGMGGMGGMPGMGGAGGAGGMDFAKLMEQINASGGLPEGLDDGPDADSDKDASKDAGKPAASKTKQDEPEIEEVE